LQHLVLLTDLHSNKPELILNLALKGGRPSLSSAAPRLPPPFSAGLFEAVYETLDADAASGSSVELVVTSALDDMLELAFWWKTCGLRARGAGRRPYRTGWCCVALPHFSDRLDPCLFVRIHRSSVVNLNQIQEIYREGLADGVVVLTSGQKLKMSKSDRQKLGEVGKL
jgi:hypothetical protein